MDLIGSMDAAEILGINRVTVWRMVQRGELKPAHIRERGRREILFERAEIEQLLEERDLERAS